MINMDTEKDYGEAHLNPLQRQNMRIFIEATKRSHGFGRRRRAFHP